MIPVYQQGNGNEIGISIEKFHNALASIPVGKRIAILLRDFPNRAISNLFSTTGVFVELDRLSGDELDIYYADNDAISRSFERVAKVNLPHRVGGGVYIVLATSLGELGFDNVEVHEIANANDITAFQNIFEIVRVYKDGHLQQSTSGWNPLPAIGQLAIAAFAGYIANIAAR